MKKYLYLLLFGYSYTCFSSTDLASEHNKIRANISKTKAFIENSEKFLLSKKSHLSDVQKSNLLRSQNHWRSLMVLDCKLLTLEDESSDTNGSEHRFQRDACEMEELERRAKRMAIYLCPESYFEGGTPECEELRNIEALSATQAIR